ncbi:2'-5' RNA ligase family protein [Pseudoblastomonas halimionae]|uniref:2'-5' RNA ligase family protein n=1 Tax=Alteriqipengyuania halimionae TaxID=1926630 RepID=UPI002D7F10F4|nr:2'-5' RNA ligase family protein [Alteriqipengyuania halimionae]
MENSDDAPLIMTAQLSRDVGAWATGLRRAHFPRKQNFLDAHVTLFHALPPFALEEVKGCCAVLAGQYGPVDARVTGVMNLGGGTAIKVESEGMDRIRDELQNRFHGLLTQQDQGGKKLHITIQNKVSNNRASAVQEEIEKVLKPRDFQFPALELHRYRGGPWELVQTYAFRGLSRA